MRDSVHCTVLYGKLKNLALGRKCLYTVKKGERHSRPQPECHLPNSLWAGISILFPPRDGLVSEIPAGDENVANLFLQCILWRPFCRMWQKSFDSLIHFYKILGNNCERITYLTRKEYERCSNGLINGICCLHAQLQTFSKTFED